MCAPADAPAPYGWRKHALKDSRSHLWFAIRVQFYGGFTAPCAHGVVVEEDAPRGTWLPEQPISLQVWSFVLSELQRRGARYGLRCRWLDRMLKSEIVHRVISRHSYQVMLADVYR